MNLTDMFFVYCEKITEVYPRLQVNPVRLSDEMINEAEHSLGFQLPETLIEWFSLVGEGEFGLEGFLVGLDIYTIKDMLEEWKTWREYDDDKELNDPLYYSSKPIGAILCRYTNPRWIPLAHDHNSNYIGVDLDPDKNGGVGQVINFGRDENHKVVFAESLYDLICLLVRFQDEMQVMEYGNQNMYINEDDEHPLDWLKQKNAIV